MTTAVEAPERLFDKRTPFAIALLVLVLSVPLMHRMGEQQASRMAFTAAVWDHGTFEIDRYEEILGRDRAVVDGVTYSDKAPGQPLLMLPYYGIYRAVGGEPADVARKEGNLGLWWLTLWTSAIPAAALAVLMFRWVAEVKSETALPATLSIALGTLLLPYATLLFAHVLTALFVFLSYLMIRKKDVSTMQLVGAGAFAGLAVLVEYPTALIVLVVLAAVIYVHRKRAVAFIAGGIPALLAVLTYNAVLFGGPLVFPYQWSAWTEVHDQARGLGGMVIQTSNLGTLFEALFDERGLFIATPIVLVALVGIYLLCKSGLTVDGVVVAGVVVAMLVLLSTRGNPYAGGPGPRYFVPALPFLALPIGFAWRRFRRTTLLAASISLLTMVAATWTEPQLDPAVDAGLGFWLRRAVSGRFSDVIVSGWLGLAALSMIFGLVVLAIWLASRTSGFVPSSEQDLPSDRLSRDQERESRWLYKS